MKRNKNTGSQQSAKNDTVVINLSTSDIAISQSKNQQAADSSAMPAAEEIKAQATIASKISSVKKLRESDEYTLI